MTKLYDAAVFVVGPVLRLIWRPTIVGKENIPHNEGSVLICNHRKWWDPLLIAVCAPKLTVHWLAKKELYKNWLFSAVLRGLGTYPVDRQKVDTSAVRWCIDVVKQNEVLGIFPEGTRNHDTFGMQQIHGGAVWIALKSGAPIVPVFIDSRGAFRRTRFFVGEKLSFSLQEGQRLNAQTRDAAAEKLAESLLCLEKMAEKASNH